MQAAIFKTSLGWAAILATEAGIKKIFLPRQKKKELLAYLNRHYPGIFFKGRPQNGAASFTLPKYAGLESAATAVKEFLAGKRKELGLYLDYSPLPPFFKKVYGLVRRIPYAQTRSYAWVAKAAGKPGAARAVGNALARNPFPLAIPCHRVIKSDGSPGDFGGGTRLKKKLLKLESEAAGRGGK